MIHHEPFEFELGRAEVLASGSDALIVACGVMVSVALSARERLAAEGISVAVINSSSIKPLDREGILAAAENVDLVVTAEEHQIIGGLGSAVCELLAEESPRRVVRVGVDDRFGQSGKADELLSHYGLDVDGLVTAVKAGLSG